MLVGGAVVLRCGSFFIFMLDEVACFYVAALPYNLVFEVAVGNQLDIVTEPYQSITDLEQ